MSAWKFLRFRRLFYTPTVWNVATNVAVVDGRQAPYTGVQPGDIIELAAGTHEPIVFKNLAGTSIRPILIRNGSGLVEFSDDSEENAIAFYNCSHFRLSGSGYSGITYGIKISTFYSKAILGVCKTRDVEIDHIEFLEGTVVGTYSIGVHILTYGLPSEYVNAYNWDAYDYSNSGSLDPSDAVDGRTWTHGNLSIHDCHFNGTAGQYNFGMGMYIGPGNYTENPLGRDLYNSSGVLVPGVPVYHPPIDNFYCYNNFFEHTSRKCVKIGGVLGTSDIYGNIMTDVTTDTEDHWGAIDINPGCNISKIHHNTIIDTNYGMGIYSWGDETLIHNNLIVNPGYYGIVVGALRPAGYHPGKNQRIFNNTIVSSYNAPCIGFANSEGSDDRVQNNILINSYGAGNYIDATLDVSDHNITASTVGTLFVDAPGGNYHLANGSSAIDAGVNLFGYGVTTDLAGVSRPSSGAFDAGAYEKV